MITPEVGKRYRTRDGSEVVVEVPELRFGDYLVIRREGSWHGHAFTERTPIGADGKLLPDSAPHPLDLIECIGESDE